MRAGDPGNDHVYKPEQFTTFDEARNLWGSSEVSAMYPTDWYLCVSASVYDGDDGGRTQLTAYFERVVAEDGDKLAIRYMVQELDTEMDFIIQGGEFHNLPED